MLLKLGYSDDEVGRFIAGPAFLAWWEMNNLEGWGGPLPRSWYGQQEALQKKILGRERELGMKPVLPGYCGMMPHDAKAKLGLDVTRAAPGTDTPPGQPQRHRQPLRRDCDLYYRELTRLYGKADYYSMDPFHETADDASVDYGKAGQKLLAAMKRGQTTRPPGWIQGWTENPRPAMIDHLPEGDLLVLDLFSECRPMFGAPSIWQRPRATASTSGCSACSRTSGPTWGCTAAWTSSSTISRSPRQPTRRSPTPASS
jgi:alpha-N-acetylglucosaminidase